VRHDAVPAAAADDGVRERAHDEREDGEQRRRDEDVARVVDGVAVRDGERRHDGGGGELAADERRQVVEHRQRQPRPVQAGAGVEGHGEHEDRQVQAHQRARHEHGGGERRHVGGGEQRAHAPAEERAFGGRPGGAVQHRGRRRTAKVVQHW
jgi:hypothetical protein